jgi:predicted acetyltransferase
VSDVTIRPGQPDEIDLFVRSVARAFNWMPKPADLELDRLLLEPERTLLAEDGADVVGTAAIFSLTMTMPGLVSTPIAGITAVGVAPTHRRQGVLTALMHRQLDDLAEREAVAVLLASEPVIYGRFGYGLATRRMSVHASRRGSTLRPELPTGGATVRQAEPDAVGQDLAAVYDRACADRVGFWARDDRWWRHRLHDPPEDRDGYQPLLAAVADVAGEPAGYALYSAKPNWDDDAVPAGSIRVRELVALSVPAHTALWRYLTALDLIEDITVWNLAPDDPLPLLVANTRQLRARVTDYFWTRVVRVGDALSTRRYARPLDVVLDVVDPLRPDNQRCWRLSGDPTGASCQPTTATADLEVDVRALGGAYLGGTTLLSLAEAGMVVENTPGALVEVSSAFREPREPFAPMGF